MSIVHGVDANNVVKPLLLDASGNVIVSSAPPTTTGGKIALDANGNVKTLEQESIYNVPESNFVSYSNLSLAAGNQTVDIYTIPGGTVYRVTWASMVYLGTVTTVKLSLSVDRGGVWHRITGVNLPASGNYYGFAFSVIANGGDIFKVTITNATLNDDLYCALFMERLK